ncbi:hypothetical protein [uncultured Microbulbifer sp.]|uniref:hypothetical protein n=1 Tax=uncultured Microbulbifer sp. TaxID=348147 RepID=UPI0026004908|nr:hypothetical protein [uncultured Microbulbifer sp.]
MKHLLGLGAAAALIFAGSAYAGDYDHDYGNDCYECSDEITIELVGEVECVCEIEFEQPVAFLNLSLIDTFVSGTQNLSVDCNTNDDLNIIFESLNGGLLHEDGVELIPYEILLGGAPVAFAAPVAFDGDEDVSVDVNGNGPLAGMYSDTVTVTVFVD